MHPDLMNWFVWVAPQTQVYRDEPEWTKGGQIVAKDGCFWKDTRLCIPNDQVLKHKLLFKLHDIGSPCHRGYASTRTKAIDRFWWRRIRQDVND
jgi:hypothetical protein